MTDHPLRLGRWVVCVFAAFHGADAVQRQFLVEVEQPGLAIAWVSVWILGLLIAWRWTGVE